MPHESPEPSSPDPVRPPWRRRLLFTAIFFLAVPLGRFLIFLAAHQSWKKSLGLSRWISRRVEPLTRKRRWQNYQAFFGEEKSDASLAELDAAHTEYLARMRTDIAEGFSWTHDDLREANEISGLENLHAVLGKKRGALLVGGHTGTWWHVPSLLAISGFPVTVIFTHVKSKVIERKLLEVTSRFKVRVAFVGRDALRALKRAAAHNEIIYLTFDVTVRPKQFSTCDFGQSGLQIDNGPALAAVRHGIPVLQCESFHHGETKRKIVIRPASELELDPASTTPAALCQLWLNRLEAEVRRHPEQWWAWGYVDLKKTSGENFAEKG